MDKYHLFAIVLVLMLLLINFQLPVYAQDPPSIRADPEVHNVYVNVTETKQSEVTLTSTFSVNRTITFQEANNSAFPKVDLYGISMSIPANSSLSRNVTVQTGNTLPGKYNLTLKFYFQEDTKKQALGHVTFKIDINYNYKLAFPLKVEPRTLDVSVPAGLFIDKVIKLTNIAGYKIDGTIHPDVPLCSNTPGIEILGSIRVILEKNKSTKIIIRIHGAPIGSIDCSSFSLGIQLWLGNYTYGPSEYLVIFNIKTVPGLPLMIFLLIAVPIIYWSVKRWLKRTARR